MQYIHSEFVNPAKYLKDENIKTLALNHIGTDCPFLLVFGVPIMSPTPEHSDIAQGEITAVMYNNSTSDISVYLDNDKNYYYINHGMEKVSVGELRETLLHQCAQLHYVRHWSLLNFKGRYRHVAQISVGNQILYSEFK